MAGNLPLACLLAMAILPQHSALVHPQAAPLRRPGRGSACGEAGHSVVLLAASSLGGGGGGHEKKGGGGEDGGAPATASRLKAKDMNVEQLTVELRDVHNVVVQGQERKQALVERLQALRDPRSRASSTTSTSSSAKGQGGGGKEQQGGGDEGQRRGRLDDNTGIDHRAVPRIAIIPSWDDNTGKLKGGGGKEDTEALRSWGLFEGYYTRQLRFMGGEEQKAMFDALKRPLPITFRLADVGTRSDAVDRERADKFKSKVQGLLDEGGASSVRLKTLEWYPNLAAYEINVSPMGMRDATLRPLQEFLVGEAGLGKIWRQEAVSMVPVLLLGASPGDTVLDMCAALLEAVSRPHPHTGGVAGAVVANDPDVGRAQMMIHRTKNLRSPALMATHYLGQRFPTLRTQGAEHDVAFDAVLCDVPCSGDGTLRKYVATEEQTVPKMRWHPDRGNKMHKAQLEILLRGLEMVKVGGHVAYSTCSLNPVENEAVVSAALSLCGDAIDVVDCQGMLAGLITSPGVTRWEVSDKNEAGRFYTSFDEVPPSRKQREARGGGDAADRERRGLFPTMFPPAQDEHICGALARCLRILPHHQDTSGFFVCLIAKAKPLPTSLREAYPLESEEDDSAFQDPGDRGKQSREDGADPCEVKEAGEDVAEDEGGGGGDYSHLEDIPGGGEAYADIEAFYGLLPSFPRQQLVARSQRMSQIRYVSLKVASLVGSAVVPGGERPRVGTAGVLAFQDKRWERDAVRHRLGMEGLTSILPMMTKRIFRVGAGTYRTLLVQRDLDPEEIPGVEEIAVGTFVVTLSSGADASAAGALPGPDAWAVVCWRAQRKILLFCDKEETSSLLQAFEMRA